jgi:5-methylcytosine-specific restriction protein A
MFMRTKDDHGKQSRGNKLEEVVWAEFAGKPAGLKRVVSAILDATQAASGDDTPILPNDDQIEAREGQLLTRVHRVRERNAAIVKRKKASYLKKHGHLCCEACGFDFQAVYGDRGEGFNKARVGACAGREDQVDRSGSSVRRLPPHGPRGAPLVVFGST